MEKNRGHTMPLMPSKDDMWERFIFALTLIFGAAIFVGITINEEKDIATLLLWMLAGCFSIVAVAMFLIYGFAKLHFTPENVSITLFGLTLKRFPAEKIRLITAVRAVPGKGAVRYRIALCDYSLEELTNHAYKATPKLLRNSREFRTGEWANDYLTKKVARGLIPDRRVFFLYWNPKRLETLRSLYPQIPWMDLTKDKIFDKQLKTEVIQ